MLHRSTEQPENECQTVLLHVSRVLHVVARVQEVAGCVRDRERTRISCGTAMDPRAVTIAVELHTERRHGWCPCAVTLRPLPSSFVLVQWNLIFL